MKSQEQLINEFNLLMIAEGSVVRIKAWNSDTISKGTYTICLPNTKFVSSFVLNTTDVFRSFLRTFFKQNGVNSISFNNDGSIFWHTPGD